jgi:hypothetical protein
MKYLEIKVRAQLKRIHAVSSREGRLYFEDENGYRRVNGKIPQLTASTENSKLDEMIKILKKL